MLPDFGAPVRPGMGAPGGAPPSAGPPPPGPPGGPGSSPDQVNSGVQAVMSDIRDLGRLAAKIGSTVPPLQEEATQIQAIIRRMIIKAGQAAPTQTDSAAALPVG